MLETFRKLWKIKDLQKKVLYTFLMLLIYRLVGVIPAPGIDVSRLNESNNFMQLPLLNMMQMMTGNAFGQMTIMAMGITPYINASIIMQLLAVAFPSLQRMQEEEGGQEKMARIENCIGCRHCSSRCPYQLDTPNLLKYMLKDYREFYETHKDEL